MSELKPCPFCGSKYTQVRYMGVKWLEPSAFSSGFRGECCDCYAVTSAYGTEAEAVAAWNARAERTCRIVEYDEAPAFVCSECGAVQPDDFTVYYCWNCGAKVVR